MHIGSRCRSIAAASALVAICGAGGPLAAAGTTPRSMSSSDAVAVSGSASGAHSGHPVRGIVKAEAEATISSELVANVIRVPYKPGQHFSKGQPIVQFDCRRYVAELAAALAEARAAEQTMAMNEGLRRHQALGAHELAISATKLEQARAQVQALKVRTDQCVIAAPYDGYVTERLINEFEMPQPNAPLLRIVKDGPLELGLIVPSHWLVWLQPGQVFKFRVEETMTTHDARVLRVGAVVDPISRTASIEAGLIEAGGRVRPGMSGTATFMVPAKSATR